MSAKFFLGEVVNITTPAIEMLRKAAAAAKVPIEIVKSTLKVVTMEGIGLQYAGLVWLGASVLQLAANILLGYNKFTAFNGVQLVATFLWTMATFAQIRATPEDAWTYNVFGNIPNLMLLFGSCAFIVSSSLGISKDVYGSQIAAAVGASCFMLAAGQNAINLPGTAKQGAAYFTFGALITMLNVTLGASGSFKPPDSDTVNWLGLTLGVVAGVAFCIGGTYWSTAPPPPTSLDRLTDVLTPFVKHHVKQGTSLDRLTDALTPFVKDHVRHREDMPRPAQFPAPAKG